MKKLHARGLFAAFACAAATMPACAVAQQTDAMPDMQGMHGMHAAAADHGDATPAFKAADERMMQDMNAPRFTGDADRDFVAHMIPHHRGAIEMAQVELKYGKDPELKRLARNIVKAQQDEVAFLRGWQAKHGGSD